MKIFFLTLIGIFSFDCLSANKNLGEIKIPENAVLLDDSVRFKSLQSGEDYILRVCKYKNGDLQPFYLFKQSDGNYSLISEGVEISSGVLVNKSSLCNGEKRTLTVSGKVRISNSYVQAGSINGDIISPDSKEDEFNILIEGSSIKGDATIEKKVEISNSEIFGNPIIQGSFGDGVLIQDSILTYPMIELQTKGIFGSASLMNVYMNGNVDIFSGSSLPNKILKQVIKKDKSYKIKISNLGTKEFPGIVGNVSILNNVNIQYGTLKGNFCINGDLLDGVKLIYTDIKYADVQDVKGIVGNVIMDHSEVDGNPFIGGLQAPTETLIRNLCEKNPMHKNLNLTPKKVSISYSKIFKNPSISGNVIIKTNSEINGNHEIANFVEDELRPLVIYDSKLIQIDPSKKPLIKRDVYIEYSPINGSPKFIGRVDVMSVPTNGDPEVLVDEVEWTKSVRIVGGTIDGSPKIQGGPMEIRWFEMIGSPTIRGKLSVTSANIYGDGNYIASQLTDSYMGPEWGSDIKINFSGNNNFSGVFSLMSSLKDVTVNASDYPEENVCHGIGIERGAEISQGTILKGSLRIDKDSKVLDGASIVSSNPNSVCLGLLNSSLSGAGTTLGGEGFFHNSTFSGGAQVAIDVIGGTDEIWNMINIGHAVMGKIVYFDPSNSSSDKYFHITQDLIGEVICYWQNTTCYDYNKK